jgi:hypothetical protein
MRSLRIGSIALVAISLLLVACGSNNQAATPTQIVRTSTFELSACTVVAVCGTGGGKPGHGMARVDIKADSYTVTVTMNGLDPNTSHLINIHPGTCAAPILTVPYVHVDVAKADANGTLTSITTWPGAYTIPALGEILTVHGADEISRENHIACANMPA